MHCHVEKREGGFGLSCATVIGYDVPNLGISRFSLRLKNYRPISVDKHKPLLTTFSRNCSCYLWNKQSSRVIVLGDNNGRIAWLSCASGVLTTAGHQGPVSTEQWVQNLCSLSGTRRAAPCYQRNGSSWIVHHSTLDRAVRILGTEHKYCHTVINRW